MASRLLVDAVCRLGRRRRVSALSLLLFSLLESSSIAITSTHDALNGFRAGPTIAILSNLLCLVAFFVVVDFFVVDFEGSFCEDLRRLIDVDVEADDARFSLVFLVSIHPLSSLGVVDLSRAVGLLATLGGSRMVIWARGLVKNCSARLVHLKYTTVLEKEKVRGYLVSPKISTTFKALTRTPCIEHLRQSIVAT